MISTAQMPPNIYRTLPTNTVENKRLLLFLRLYVLRICVQTNELVFLPVNITDLFLPSPPFSFLHVVRSVLQTMFSLSPGRKLYLSSEHDVMAESSDVRLGMRLSGSHL